MVHSREVSAKVKDESSRSVNLSALDPSILDDQQRKNEFGRVVLRALERIANRGQKIIQPKRSKTQLNEDDI